jgi:hypothetical protein
MEKLPALYVLTGQYLELADKLADSDFDAQTVADTIESTGILDDIKVKAQGIEMVARNLEEFDPAIEAEIGRLERLRERRAKKAEALRAYLLDQMKALGIEKIQCPLFSLSVRKNPPKVDVFDERMVPADFLVTPPAPPARIDKAAIGKALRAGQDVPGCTLAHSVRLHVE